MEISSNNIPQLPTLTLAGATARPAIAWRIGQELIANVIRMESPTSALIELAGQRMRAVTELTLNPGQQLRLIVARLADPLLLKIVTENPVTETLNRALRSTLPRQTPLAETFNLWTQLLRPDNPTLNKLPPPVITQMREILGKLPSLKTTSADLGLRTFTNNSGLFFEAALSTALFSRDTAVHENLKTILPQLAAQIKATATGPMGTTSDPAPFAKAAAAALGTKGHALPEALKTILLQLAAAAKTTTPDPASTATATTRNSGQFLDAALAALAPGKDPLPVNLSADMKALLLRLKAQLMAAIDASHSHQTLELLERLLRQTESSLARIQTHQLQSLKQDPEAQTLRFDIPLQQDNHTDNFSLRIRREPSTDEQQGNEFWNVRLHFNLADLGPVEATITLKKSTANSERVNIAFTSEQPQTAALFDQQLDYLHRDLSGAGLDIGRISSRPGPVSDRDTLPGSPLLHEKA